MEPRSLGYVADGSGGVLESASPSMEISRVTTDSRQVRAGDLFVAVAGDRFDGHDYLAEVMAKGAAAALVAEARAGQAPPGLALIRVADTRQALGRLAARYRGDYTLPVTAVGGSNGKTTTKDLIAFVLGGRYCTLKSPASFNNDIGVPLTLLELHRDCQAAVLEVGTNHPGELAPLVRMIQPRHGVITCVGREHLEHFGDLDGVAREEGWLAELLPASGRLFVNGDSPGIERVMARSTAAVVPVGLGEHNSWRAVGIEMRAAGVAFEVRCAEPEYEGRYQLNLLGRHQVTNGLLAIAVGAAHGLDREEIQRGLAACPASKMRMEMWQINGVRVIDDAYNANADSMLAALDTLKDIPCTGRRVAVLGDMAELGEHSAAAHAEVGRRAAELNVDQLFAVGRMAGVMGAAARAAGLTRVNELGEVEGAACAVKRFVRDGDVVLLKASRATRLERVGEMLRHSKPQS